MDKQRFRRKLLGDIFTSKTERLAIAFGTASAPFRTEIKLVDEKVAAFQRKVDAGEAVGGAPTNDDDYGSYAEDLGEQREDALEALRTLRQAFVFLIYHQWERLAQNWKPPGKSPNHEDLVNATKAEGVPIDEPGLEILRLLVNTLKHNSSKLGPDLYNRRPDFFKVGFDPNGTNSNTGMPYNNITWVDQIELNDDHIDEFLGIIMKSLPI